eukprot:403375382
MIMAQLFLAVDYMHNQNFIHRDLKLPNILLKSSTEGNFDLRVGDFGLCINESLSGPKNFEICGTPTYIAPEVLNEFSYTNKVDIFSLGSIMYNLITGRYLFQKYAENDNILYLNKICKLDHIELHIQRVSTEARDLLWKCLDKNPQTRLSAREALQHPWFKSDRDALDAGLVLNDQILQLTHAKCLNITSQMMRNNEKIMPLKKQRIGYNSGHQSVLNFENSNERLKYDNSRGSNNAGFTAFTKNRQITMTLLPEREMNSPLRLNSRKDQSPLSYYEIISSNRKALSKSPLGSNNSKITIYNQKSVFTPHAMNNQVTSFNQQMLLYNNKQVNERKSSASGQAYQISNLQINSNILKQNYNQDSNQHLCVNPQYDHNKNNSSNSSLNQSNGFFKEKEVKKKSLFQKDSYHEEKLQQSESEELDFSSSQIFKINKNKTKNESNIRENNFEGNQNAQNHQIQEGTTKQKNGSQVNIQQLFKNTKEINQNKKNHKLFKIVLQNALDNQNEEEQKVLEARFSNLAIEQAQINFESSPYQTPVHCQNKFNRVNIIEPEKSIDSKYQKDQCALFQNQNEKSERKSSIRINILDNNFDSENSQKQQFPVKSPENLCTLQEFTRREITLSNVQFDLSNKKYEAIGFMASNNYPRPQRIFIDVKK